MSAFRGIINPRTRPCTTGGSEPRGTTSLLHNTQKVTSQQSGGRHCRTRSSFHAPRGGKHSPGQARGPQVALELIGLRSPVLVSPANGFAGSAPLPTGNQHPMGAPRDTLGITSCGGGSSLGTRDHRAADGNHVPCFEKRSSREDCCDPSRSGSTYVLPAYSFLRGYWGDWGNYGGVDGVSAALE